MLDGDDAAWRALYDRAFDGVYAYVAARLRGSPDRIDETVQDAWLVAVRRIRAFDPSRAPFRAWMRGVAEGVLMNRLRKDARRARTTTNATDADVDPDRGAARPTTDRDLVAEVAATLASLPAAYGDVLRAKYRDGLTVAEIATRTGRTAKAAESLLTRARDAFRRLFPSEDRP